MFSKKGGVIQIFLIFQKEVTKMNIIDGLSLLGNSILGSLNIFTQALFNISVPYDNYLFGLLTIFVLLLLCFLPKHNKI